MSEGGGTVEQVRFLGAREAYARIQIRGAILLGITLGIYRFWLATDTRRFLWANSEIAGETLEYNGTALELLIGFLAAVAILVPAYTLVFLAALDLGLLGKVASVLAVAGPFAVGQWAVYRARNYRLTRTIFRGLRFHQDGSALLYALFAVCWWTLTVLTFGLAYPFQLAGLERFKLRHTLYGDLRASFAGSGTRLFLRGLPMWLAVCGPLVAAVVIIARAADWTAISDAVTKGGADVGEKVANSSPGFETAIGIAALLLVFSVIAALALYPVFQALVLRWWCSGLRFGGIAARSRLRTKAVYGAYGRLLGFAVLFSIGISIATSVLAGAIGAVFAKFLPDQQVVVASGLVLVGYVAAALGYSAIYRIFVVFALWRLGMESLELTGLSALANVQAAGHPVSALGEGLANALHVESL